MIDRPNAALRERLVFQAKVSGPLLRTLVGEVRAAVREVVIDKRHDAGLPAALDRLLSQVQAAPLSFVHERQARRVQAEVYGARLVLGAEGRDDEGDDQGHARRGARRGLR